MLTLATLLGHDRRMTAPMPDNVHQFTEKEKSGAECEGGTAHPTTAGVKPHNPVALFEFQVASPRWLGFDRIRCREESASQMPESALDYEGSRGCRTVPNPAAHSSCEEPELMRQSFSSICTARQAGDAAAAVSPRNFVPPAFLPLAVPQHVAFRFTCDTRQRDNRIVLVSLRHDFFPRMLRRRVAPDPERRAFSKAMATACFCGRPESFNSRMLADIIA